MPGIIHTGVIREKLNTAVFVVYVAGFVCIETVQMCKSHTSMKCAFQDWAVQSGSNIAIGSITNSPTVCLCSLIRLCCCVR
jgi:hypothetical protein